MRIGGVSIAHPVTLAPMEEHTNHPFRLLMKRHGASYVCTERVDAHAVARRDRRALRVLHHTAEEGARAGQISGADPIALSEAARVIEQLGYPVVDLNFECPIRRLMDRGEGGALLGDPPRVEAIVRRVVASVGIPVTIKIRTGLTAEQETAVEIARRAEQCGVAAVDVHARSVAQGYVGGPDWAVIRRVREAVNIAVLGSGGIRVAQDVGRFLDETGADGVAIGRGCLGNPWIFAQSTAYLRDKRTPAPPSARERGRALLQLAEGELRYYGMALGIRRLPRTCCYFAKFVPDFPVFRKSIQGVRDVRGLRALVRSHFG